MVDNPSHIGLIRARICVTPINEPISSSGCIEALDAFNNSQDILDSSTPAPFDRPPLNDFGQISGADPSSARKAKGHAKNERLVIGKDIKGAFQCKP